MASITLAPPLAHLGHWYVSLPVFMGPVVVLALALKVQTWREAHRGPNRKGKRSTVSSSSADERVTIAVSGPLDYPALLETEVELGKLARDAQAIVLDLRRLTTADEESASGLCDVIAGTHADERISVLLPREPCASPLNEALRSEGIRLVHGGGLAVNG